MSTMLQDAERRLTETLSAPVQVTRHAQVTELATDRVATGRPQDIEVKEVAAVVEPASSTDKLTGEFEATVSTFDLDLQGDRFAPGAFNDAIGRIRATGKATPIFFAHAIGDALSVLGMIPSSGWKIDDEGLHASGWIDVSDVLGQRIHRMLGQGALQWSVGFRKPLKRPGPRGTTTIESIGELHEVSVTALPANPATRTFGVKAAAPSLADLRALEQRLLGDDTDVHYKTLLYDATLHLLRLDQTKATRRTPIRDIATPTSRPMTSRPAGTTRPRSTGPLNIATFDA